MSPLLNRFSLHTAKWDEGIGIAVIFIWLIILGCIVSSILSQPFDRRQRIFWIVIVILVPGIGILAYLPFAVRKEELPSVFKRKPKHSRHSKQSSIGPDA
jgi:hypothetical protein